MTPESPSEPEAPATPPGPSQLPWLGLLGCTLIILGVFGAGFWAGQPTSQPKPQLTSQPEPKPEPKPEPEFQVKADDFAYFQTANQEGIPVAMLINGEKWKLQRVDRIKGDVLIGTDAETFCERRMIVYLRISDPRELRNTIWHEIFHAGACLHPEGNAWWNSESGWSSHQGIYHLGDFMTEFAMANKPFMDWVGRRE